MPEKRNRPGAQCSFCGHFASQAGPMVEGPADVYICRKCVVAAQAIYDEMDRLEKDERAFGFPVVTPPRPSCLIPEVRSLS